MQELYIIRQTACHKPWRYSGTTYTTNKKLFDFLKNSDESFLPEFNWAEYAGVEEEEDYDWYDCMEEGSVIPVYPFIVLDEVEVYTE